MKLYVALGLPLKIAEVKVATPSLTICVFPCTLVFEFDAIISIGV